MKQHYTNAIRSKDPIPWEKGFSVDGMFGNGDVMVWIHDLKYLGGRSFEVPPRMSNDNHRVIPLATATALLSLPMVS